MVRFDTMTIKAYKRDGRTWLRRMRPLQFSVFDRADLVVVEDYVQRPGNDPRFKSAMSAAMDCAKVTGYILGLLSLCRKRTIIIPAMIWKRQATKFRTVGRNPHERDAARLAQWGLRLVKKVVNKQALDPVITPEELRRCCPAMGTDEDDWRWK